MDRMSSPKGPFKTVDPINVFMSAAAAKRHPMPLIATSYDVTFEGGLAVITAKRQFRNTEPHSIEAILTLPLPVGATVFELEARIGDRHLRAISQDKSAARKTYENALETGKTAVLHEELMPGIHMLSVGQIGANVTVDVTTTFAMAAAAIGLDAAIRIPLTIGDVYGQTPLDDVDTPIHAPNAGTATLTVTAANATITLNGTAYSGTPQDVLLSRPIDLSFSGWTRCELSGIAANGQDVSLRLSPAAPGSKIINASLLLDRSASMNDRCRAGTDQTKHQAAVAALSKAALDFHADDHIELWQFGDTAERIGPLSMHHADRRHVRHLLSQLSAPQGGTEVGSALHTVTRSSRARSILLITDGKSYAVDVHALLGQHCRFSAVLVGEDSLDARIAHLVALTGGEIFVTGPDTIDAAVQAALQSLRRGVGVPRSVDPTSDCTHLIATMAGMDISATWTGGTVEAFTGERSLQQRAVAAYAAHLRLAELDAPAATKLAVAEGIVSHVTSLVLVDEAGQIQHDVPASRKIALASPMLAISDASGNGISCLMAADSDELFASFGQPLPQLNNADYFLNYTYNHNQLHKYFDNTVDVQKYEFRSVADSATTEPTSNIVSRLISPPDDRTQIRAQCAKISEKIDWSAVETALRGSPDLTSSYVVPEYLELEIATLSARSNIIWCAHLLRMNPEPFALCLCATLVAPKTQEANQTLSILLSGRDRLLFETITKLLMNEDVEITTAVPPSLPSGL
jgi:hypothetical protein